VITGLEARPCKSRDQAEQINRRLSNSRTLITAAVVRRANGDAVAAHRLPRPLPRLSSRAANGQLFGSGLPDAIHENDDWLRVKCERGKPLIQRAVLCPVEHPGVMRDFLLE
jgi:hypothetical protein